MKGNCALKILLLVISILPYINCDCKISENSNWSNFVGAFQKIGNDIYQLPETREITLDTDNFVYLICPGGFELKDLLPNEKYAIKVRCKENGITEYGNFYSESNFFNNEIKSTRTTNNFKYDRYGNLEYDEYGKHKYETEEILEKSSKYSCKGRNLKIFQGNAEESLCEHASYAIGYQLGNKVIILMELCFNPVDKKLDFVHYLQSQKTHPISEIYNPVNASGINRASLPVVQFFDSLRNEISHMKEVSNDFFVIDSIVPFSIFKPFQIESFSHLSRISNIIWLKNLFEGKTRKLFLELLEERKETVQYNVFVGTSNKITEETTNVCNETIRKEVNIPKYIWTYLRSNDEDIDEEFIVINVNSPFADYQHWNETILCKDICSTFEWLKPMEKIRQMPYLGYMFCCNATEEIKNRLDGFPKLSN